MTLTLNIPLEIRPCSGITQPTHSVADLTKLSRITVTADFTYRFDRRQPGRIVSTADLASVVRCFLDSFSFRTGRGCSAMYHFSNEFDTIAGFGHPARACLPSLDFC